ncbi:unnamed protein product [Peniophora sp. CBMAI 1063]|nr:unnamed protein product [Peniophora sp. CBMAI 1063]
MSARHHLSARALGKRPARDEEEEEEEEGEDVEFDHGYGPEARSESAASLRPDTPLFTMPLTGAPARFAFWFKHSDKATLRDFKQKVLDNGGALAYDGRSGKAIYESNKPDVDIFVFDDAARYEKAVGRFRTSTITRVYLARKIDSWISSGSFDFHVPVTKGMPGRPPGQMYRTNFTAEDEDLMCHFLAQWLPDENQGGRQGANAYEQMLLSRFDWPGAERHSAESWRSYYVRNKSRLDPIIREIAEQQPPSETGLGVDHRVRRERLLPRVSISPLDDEDEGVLGEEGSEASVDRSRDSTPAQRSSSTSEKRRRSVGEHQGTNSKRRRQESRPDRATVLPKVARTSRTASIAGSDAHHPIELDDFGPEADSLQSSTQRPQKNASKMQHPQLRSSSARPSSSRHRSSQALRHADRRPEQLHTAKRSRRLQTSPFPWSGEEAVDRSSEEDALEVSQDLLGVVADREMPRIDRRAAPVQRQSGHSEHGTQHLRKVQDAQRRSAPNRRAPVVTASGDEDSDLEGCFLEKHSRTSSSQYFRRSSLSDRALSVSQ